MARAGILGPDLVFDSVVVSYVIGCVPTRLELGLNSATCKQSSKTNRIPGFPEHGISICKIILPIK